MRLEFNVYGTPRPAGSKRAFVRAGRATVVDANPESRPWKQEVASAALAELDNQGCVGPMFATGPVFLRLTFYLRRPKSHYRTNGQLKAAAPFWHTKAPDALKLSRAVEDALSGLAYRDDSQISREFIRKQYDVQERVEVVVTRLWETES